MIGFDTLIVGRVWYGQQSQTREWLANDGREGFYEGERDGEEIYAPATPPMTDAEEIQVGEKSYKSVV